jgi:hypothetical protein
MAVAYWMWLRAGSSITSFLQNLISNNDAAMSRLFSLVFIPVFLLSIVGVIGSFIRHRRVKTQGSVSAFVIYAFLLFIGLLSFFNASLSYLILFVIVAPAILLILLLIFLAVTLFALLGTALGFLIWTLSNKKGLRGALTVLGIASFILGNILQFLAE